MNLNNVLVALVCGVASVFMIAVSSRFGFAGVPLLLAGPLPVYFAALAFGTAAGTIASIVAMFSAAMFVSPQSAIIVGLLFTIPASIIGHQANLAQVNEDGETTDWYPLSHLLLNLSIVISVALVATGYFTGYDPNELAPTLKEGMREMIGRSAQPSISTEAEVELVVGRTLTLLPFMFSGAWLVVHALNLQIASLLARLGNRMPRPKDDIPTTANLPAGAIFLMIIALVLAVVLSGSLQLVAAVFAGSLTMAFAMVGLAALHLRLRHSSSATPLLVIVYLLIILFYFPLVLFSIAGVLRASRKPQSPPPANPTGS